MGRRRNGETIKKMKKEIDINKTTTTTDIAFVDNEGNPVKYGTLVSFNTKKESVYGIHERKLHLVWKFEDGGLGFVNVDKLLQCGKIRLIEEEAVNFSTIYFYYTDLARELEKMVIKLLVENYKLKVIFKKIKI